ncbi:hypothetical protein B0H16DRAFT_1468046 [Mycena metata]|uniref:Uncharacterized protein n=1 Tax=Mycena metata TaxID=1033252 RepID=A0AAD7MV73_9AGAR|nr:hypothetical protein B0H16DRAFT_1468046 [Mycena metata]
MHCVITDILCELPFHGVDLPLTCPIPAYWMRHPDHLDLCATPTSSAINIPVTGASSAKPLSRGGRGPYASSHSMVSTSPYSRPGQHDFDLSIEGKFQVRRKNYGVLYDVPNFPFGTQVALSRHFGKCNENC